MAQSQGAARCRWIGILLVLAVVLAGAGAAPARAANSGCRTDPLIVLSDGTRVTISVAIGTNRAAVRSVQYTLHAPAGLHVVSVVFFPNLGDETLQYTADAAPGHFRTTTRVDTSGPAVAVTATTAVTARGGGGPGPTGTASGWSAQLLTVGLQW